MSTIILRATKGSPLTNTEVDNNFSNLNTDKYQSGDNASFGTLGFTGALTGGTAAWTIGTSQLTKDSSGNFGIGVAASSTIKLTLLNTATDTANTEYGSNFQITANNASGSVGKYGTRSFVTTGASYAGTGVLASYLASATATVAVTGSIQSFRASISNTGSGTVAGAYNFVATSPSNTGGGTISSFFGYTQDDVPQGSATTAYTMFGAMNSGPNRWNLYMSGTAPNYLNASLGIGATNLSANIDIGKTLTGNNGWYGIRQNGAVQPDVTDVQYNRAVANFAAYNIAFNAIYGYTYTQGVPGAGTIIPTQAGYNIESVVVYGTNNYGLRSQIAAPTSGGTTASTISNISQTSTTVTVTTSAVHGLSTGQTVTVAATANITALVSGVPATLLTLGTTTALPGASSGSVTFTDVSDTVTYTAHGLSNGNPVFFSAITSTTGISTNTLYYVTSVTTNTFQVSSTRGGSALALTTDGTGTCVLGVFTASSAGTGTATVALNAQNSGKTITVTSTTAFTYTSALTATYTAVTVLGSSAVTPTTRYNLYIDGTADNYFAGNVGIGTTTPATWGTAANPTITLKGTNGSYTGRSGAFVLLGQNGFLTGALAADDGTSALQFYAYNGTAGGTERMRITSAGELLLGTTSLVAPLTVNGGAAFYTQGQTAYYNGNTNGFSLGSTSKATTPAGGGQGTIGIYSQDPTASQLQATMALITDATGANRRLGISIIEQGTGYRNITLAENGGNVGIGIATPVNKLDVTGVSGTNGDARGLITVTDTSTFATGVGGGITFRAKYNTAGAYIDAGNIKGIKENATDGNTASALAFSTQANSGSPTERLRITSNGGISVGATGTATGTSGQVLTSNGDAPPSWTTNNAATTGKAIAMAMVFGG